MELHLSPKVVSKGAKGRTACGSAAYRSGSKIVDNDGMVHDYRYKHERVAGGIELPEGAPEDLRDPQTLWQRHEIHDTRKDAQLYRDVEFSLPNELEQNGDYSACERIARAMAEPLVKQGMCVQWDIHDKYTWQYTDAEGKKHTIENPKHKVPGQEYTEVRNLHIHMMITMRELLPDGTFGKKNRAWNKFNGGLNISNLLRPKAAELMNVELAAIRSSEHVEHLSFAERGIDRIPTVHVGTTATAMERKGQKTQRGDRNRHIEWLNSIHAENMGQLEKQVGSKKLQDLIDHAESIKAGNQGASTFRDWDALFAMLRDVRRLKAAFRTEQGKIYKAIRAYDKQDAGEQEAYEVIKDNEAFRAALRESHSQISLALKELEATERLLLDCKELIKAHNRVVYADSKVDWDQHQIERKTKTMRYSSQRLRTLERIQKHLRSQISLTDALLNTPEYQAYLQRVLQLDAEKARVRSEYRKAREDKKQHKQDLKQHIKGQKDAARAIKKAKNQGGAGEDR